MKKQNDFSKIVTEALVKDGYTPLTTPPFIDSQSKPEFGIESVLMDLAQAVIVFEAMAKTIATAEESGGQIDYDNAEPPNEWAITGAINATRLVILKLEGELARMTK